LFLNVYRERGIEVRHMPILDQKASGVKDMQVSLAWVEEGLAAGEGVLMHCVGGLGRSGMAAAALLKTRGLSAEAALAEVRRARSPRAVETREQEEFVRNFLI
jgi:protein-tyrosine phosphatase